MTQSFVSIHVHVGFSAKHRQPFITDDVSPRLYDYMGGVISNQRQHHRRRTFKDEYLELLRRHEIEFDERYLWD